MRALLSPKPSRHGFGLQRRRSSPSTTTGFVIALVGARLLHRSRFPRSLWRHHLHLAGGLQSDLFRSSMSCAIRFEANRVGGTAPLLSSVLISACGNGCVVWGRMEKSRPLARWVLWRLKWSKLLAWAASSSTKFGLFAFGFVWVLGEALVSYFGPKLV